MTPLTPFGPLNTTMLLGETPMLMSHNAATSYMPNGNLYGDTYTQAIFYAKNQRSGTFYDQLNCGARALDLEIFDDSTGEVGFGHGVRVEEIDLSNGLNNILSWSSEHLEELVLLVMDCDNGLCSSRVTDILSDKNITYLTNCTMVETMTVGEALAQGPVVAVSDTCIVNNYDESLVCMGFMPGVDPNDVAFLTELILAADLNTFLANYEQARNVSSRTDIYTCWEDDADKTHALDPLWDYLKTTPNGVGTKMWKWQALWQQTNISIALGMAQPYPLPQSLLQISPSSLLMDLEKSELNKQVLEYLTTEKPNVNLITMDDVCSDDARQIIQVFYPTDETSTPTATPTATPTVAPTPASTASNYFFNFSTILVSTSLLYLATNLF